MTRISRSPNGESGSGEVFARAARFGVRLDAAFQFLGKFLQKSIDILSQVQLKGAPSLALACSAAGELTPGKNKKSGKNRKKC
jgi:hypothetical protein